MDPSFIIHLGIQSSIWGDGFICGQTDTRVEDISYTHNGYLMRMVNILAVGYPGVEEISYFS